ncbi:Putative chitin-binding, type 1, glycoside hydrolase family 18, catalytic domain-containing protein [Colletotrichum destructivum]|uniref:chitinase n=1 Tax=Colletotrichum destructivum TaxID=34406 RepID=A0AAX4I547_9PEZI|nr:Putative chitin-binding, type 1, glycoside hydrolase family 18, catalytic domain-containing protein [Colletotrichum destructivum]
MLFRSICLAAVTALAVEAISKDASCDDDVLTPSAPVASVPPLSKTRLPGSQLSGYPPSGPYLSGSSPSRTLPSASNHSLPARVSAPRYVMYFDQYHTAGIPDKSITAGVTHVITAFANSSLFASEPAGEYKPFKPINEIRALFDNGTKVCMAIGGWADTDGFSRGASTNANRNKFARNVVDSAVKLGYDCVDVDWEYPAGNGADYKQIPNANKSQEIDTFPLLLSAIKTQLKHHKMELSVTAPGLKRDMIAFTQKQTPKINAVVDHFTVMTYDLMNRRDNVTAHHTDVKGSLEAIDTYIALGVEPVKINLGFALYAKWFTTAAGHTCSEGLGCPTELLEAADGTDTGKSGAVTFEAANFMAAPTNLTTSPDASCGSGTFYKCPTGNCCSQYGFCGTTEAHCSSGCQSDYGICNGTSTAASFKTAMANGKTDEVSGGQWYWDPAGPFFWTWDTPALVSRKFNDIVKARGIGGVAAWSLGEDSHDFSLIRAIQAGVRAWPR